MNFQDITFFFTANFVWNFVLLKNKKKHILQSIYEFSIRIWFSTVIFLMLPKINVVNLDRIDPGKNASNGYISRNENSKMLFYSLDSSRESLQIRLLKVFLKNTLIVKLFEHCEHCTHGECMVFCITLR